jgi:hypothetical protein
MIVERISQEEADKLIDSGEAGMMGVIACANTDREYVVIGLPLGERGEYQNFLVKNEEGMFVKVGVLGQTKFTKQDEFFDILRSKYGYNL